MALTRRMLSAMGIESEKIDEIINAHSETVTALKEECSKYKADSEQLAEANKELESLRKKVNEDATEEYKEKYERVQKEFDDYKNDVKNKETRASKENAFKEILKSAGVSDKRIDSIVKVSGESIDSIEFDKDGNVKGSDKIAESVKTEWADFIVSEGVKGADTSKPPQSTGGKMSKDEIMKIKDPADRQKAIAENHEVFGF